MQYVKPYTYLTAKPGGAKNLLMGSLALGSTAFIPVLGQLVVLGWMAETVDDLERDPDAGEYPDFDFNKFIPYLTRSVWPFVMQLIVGLVVLVLMTGAALVGVGAYFAAGKELLVGIAVFAVLLLPTMFIGLLFQWPLTLHAQLSRGFDFGGAMRFTRSFIGTVGGQQAVALVVHVCVSSFLSFVGLLCCIVGAYPAAMLQVAAQEHFMVQLYRLYLDEGGEPIRRLDLAAGAEPGREYE